MMHNLPWFVFPFKNVWLEWGGGGARATTSFYSAKLHILIFVYYFKPPLNLGRFMNDLNADVQIALCTDTWADTVQTCL